MKRPDFLLLHAREAFNLPPDWEWFKLEAVGPHDSPHRTVLMTGAICEAVYTRGKRKGAKKWSERDKSTECTVPIKGSDHEAWLLNWEAETSKCHQCGGSGEEWFGWSIDAGNRFRTCSRCGGSGNPPIAKAEGREG